MTATATTIRTWVTPFRIWQLIAGILIVYFLIWPIGTLAVGAFKTTPFGVEGEWTLAGFTTVINDPWTPRVILASAVHSTVSTIVAMVIALYFVMITTRMDTRLRLWVGPMMVVLLATPRLFYALSWGMLGNPNNGLLARGAKLVGVESIPEWATVYSWGGLIAVTSIKLAAFAYLLLYGPATRIDRSMEDAAVMAGVPRWRAFFDVTLTSLMPALLATSMFIFVENLRLFDIPAVIGLPAGIHTLPLRVNDYLLENMRPNWSAASSLSMAIVVVIASLIYVQTYLLKNKDFNTIGGKAVPPVPVPVGRWRNLIDFSIIFYLVIALVLPVVQIVLGSFQPFFGLYGVYTLNNFREAIADDRIRIMMVTFGFAIFGGFIAVSLSFALALLMQRRPGTLLARMARLGSWVPIFAPGIVLSLALLWAYLNTPFIKLLFGTPWLMLFALIVGSIPVAVRTVEGIVAQVGREVEEAARVCGANVMSAVVQVTARLCTPSLLVAWLIVGIGISGTLDIPLLFQSLEAHTVATYAYYLMNYGQVPQAAAFFILYLGGAMIVVGSVALMGWIVRWYLLRKYRRPALREDVAPQGAFNAPA